MMADEIENEDDILELGEAPEDTQPAAEGDDTIAAAEDDDDIEIPSFGDPTEEQPDDTHNMRVVRNKLREVQQELAALKEGRDAKEPEIEVGEKPTLWDDDIAGDEDKYDAALIAYHERKRQKDAQANAVSESQKRQNEIWQARVNDFAQKRAAYPAAIMTECETALATTLNGQQQRAIIRYAKNPAALTIALGRSQAKLDALAKIDDIGEFIAETALLEKEVKLAKRKPTAQPERIVQGSASMQSGDKARDKLIEKAQAGGDVTETLRALREARKKQAA